MNTGEKLQLKKMIQESDCDDNTEQIRKLKHSVKIRDDIRNIDKIKTDNPSLNTDELSALCISEAPFLYEYYTDIFHKVVSSELSLPIMSQVLGVLKKIEDEQVDQHEGSVLVGKLLKELYVDSALKRADKLDEKYATDAPIINSGSEISWKQYKSMKSI
tara:strand:+ start:378 stop:857 length:480 start_codon:yes stop_codon:yes gene_type:complete